MSNVAIHGDLEILNNADERLAFLNGADGSAFFANQTHFFDADGNVGLAGDQFHIDTDGKISGYRSESVTGNGVVSIPGVSIRSSTDASLPAVTVVTPSADALYEVSLLVQVLSLAAGGTVDVKIHHTDDIGAEVVTALVASLNSATRVSKTVLIQAKANTPIQVSTVATDLSGHATYRVSAVVKRLT